jgi:hypothetical protein
MKDLTRTIVAAAVGALAATVVTGPAAVADQVGKAATVTSAMIKNGTIKPKDLSSKVNARLAKADTALQGIPNDSVNNFKIVDGSVFAAEVANNAVGATELADNAVDSASVVDNSLTAADLGPDSVGTSELGVDAVGSAEIDDGAIVSADLGTGSVGSNAVANNSLTLADIARATGTETVNFGNIGTGACVTSGTIGTGVDLNDAIIVLENDVAVTGSVNIHARQAQPGFTSFVIVACNSGGDYDPPSANIRWAVLD